MGVRYASVVGCRLNVEVLVQTEGKIKEEAIR